MGNSANGLTLDDVSVVFPDGDDELRVLNGLSMSVNSGEIVAITGESGSGKSTLLAVAGLLRTPTSGSVSIGGTEAPFAKKKRLAAMRQEHIGLIFQSSNLFPSLTAIEQVLLAAHVGGHLDADAKARAAELLERVGLASRADRLPAQLSGGERQRVGIARALMNRPSVLLADEPTASLDPARGAEVMAILVAAAREEGAATAIVTHVPEHAALADRIVRLEAGTVAPATNGAVAPATSGSLAQ